MPADAISGRRAIAHLLRRAGFGPDLPSLERFDDRAYALVVEELLDGLDAAAPAEPNGFDPDVPGTIQRVWLERMLAGEYPLAEKLAFFWHGHFATSNLKVRDPILAWTQYKLFRSQGGGSFRDLVLGVCRDVAMIRWLDGNANRSGHANENFGRELQELFTLGIGNYTEEDIREVARAFTGWGSAHFDFVLREQFHDTGEKTFHGQTGHFGGEDAVDILTSLPACATFICGKLLRFFSHPAPTEAQIETLATVFRESGGNIKETLRAIFLSEAFLSQANERTLVKSPVEFCVGALRAASVGSIPEWIHGGLDRMGQILFRPPSVKGWTSGIGWLSSGAIVERLRIAQRIATFPTADGGIDVAGHIVDVAFQDEVPEPLAAALEGLEEAALITMVLGCPEFQLA